MARITVKGNLTQDPELRFTPSGAAVVTLNVAENRRKFNKATGEYEDAGTTYYRVTAWREMAENLAESLSRGSRLVVEGEFYSKEFERKDGTKGLSLEIDADDVGASLKYASAKVTKTQRQNGGGGNGGGSRQPAGVGAGAPANDPWASNAGSDEPPF